MRKQKKLEVKMQEQLKEKVEEVKDHYEKEMNDHLENMKKSYEEDKVKVDSDEMFNLKMEFEKLKLEVDSKNLELQNKDLALNTAKDELKVKDSKIAQLNVDLDNLKVATAEAREQLQEQVNAKVHEAKKLYESQLGDRVAKMKEQYEGQMNAQIKQLKLKYQAQLNELQNEKEDDKINEVTVEVAVDSSEREKELEHQLQLLKEELAIAQNSIKYHTEGSVEDVESNRDESQILPGLDAPRTEWLEWFVTNMKDEEMLNMLETHPKVTERIVYIYGQSVASHAKQEQAEEMAKLKAEVNRANKFMDFLRPILRSLGLKGGDLQSEAGLSKLSAILQILQKQVLEFKGRQKELEGEKKRLQTKLEYTQDKLNRTLSEMSDLGKEEN